MTHARLVCHAGAAFTGAPRARAAFGGARRQLSEGAWRASETRKRTIKKTWNTRYTWNKVPELHFNCKIQYETNKIGLILPQLWH